MNFVTLGHFIQSKKQVYADKVSGMSMEDLADEAHSEAFLQQTTVTTSNCSVFDTYKYKYKKKCY